MMGFTVTHLQETSSTNADLKALARDGAPFGSVVIADRQTAGRGRMERRFSSESGGLYMSILLPLADPSRIGLITTYAAVAAARAIEALAPVDVKIKWVNDLYVGGKKLCGILAEGGERLTGGEKFAVLGIGVNLSNRLPDELSAIATALCDECEVAVTPEALASEILEQFKNFDEEKCHEHLDEYRHRCMILGKKIDVVPHCGKKYEAVALEILHNGALLVKRLSDGEEITVFSGEVSVRRRQERIIRTRPKA